LRRTLAILVTTVAFLTPAAAASAEPLTNASCNNGKGGNYAWTGHSYNGKGNSGKAVDCGTDPAPDPSDPSDPSDPTDPSV